MKNLLKELSFFCEKNKNLIANFLSKCVRIKSYSNNETEIVKFVYSYVTSKKKKIYVKKVKNNLILCVGNKNRFSTPVILFDAHLDTVPAENTTEWRYLPFSGKIVNDKVYGRGSCDDKSSVTALVFTAMFLAEHNFTTTVAFSLSSNEENSSGKGIEEVLNIVKPEYCVICEPSDLNIVYGHKGKWSVKLVFYGKPAHASSPSLGKNAIYSAYNLIKNIVENKNKNFKPSPLGEPVYTITYIESKTNSLNSIPYECSIYIDYRSVLGETQQSIKKFLTKNLTNQVYKFIPLHKFFQAWVLNKDNKLVSVAQYTYKQIFYKKPNLLLWQFCTNGSITMAEYNIPTIGFGPGSPFLAHSNNEYVKLNDIIQAIKFYVLLCYNF